MFKSDVEGAKALVQKYEQLKSEISKVIIGQNEIIHNTILSVFCQGHVLLVGEFRLMRTHVFRDARVFPLIHFSPFCKCPFSRYYSISQFPLLSTTVLLVLHNEVF